MNVLIISDETESKSFCQILGLKKKIQEMDVKKVDLFIFSKKGIFFNQKLIKKEATQTVNLIQRLLDENTYAVIIVSLKLNNLKKLFLEKQNILNLIEKTFPQTSIFLFGASSVIKKFDKERQNRVFLYSRPGVSKLTREFKKDVIDYIKTKL